MSKTILFASYHCYFDNSNGAAVSSRELMQAFSAYGHTVRVVSGPLLDTGDCIEPRMIARAQGIQLENNRKDEFGSQIYGIDVNGITDHMPEPLQFQDNEIKIDLYNPRIPHGRIISPSHSLEFIQVFRNAVLESRPDVIFGYGGTEAQSILYKISKKLGIVSVITLHNTSYGEASFFDDIKFVRVTSNYCKNYYFDKLGIDCLVLPNVVSPARVVAEKRDPKFVVFVNPIWSKGACVVARIAHELGKTRPDIPFLIVEARGGESNMAACGIDLREYRNVHVMPLSHDPRSFYQFAKILIMPSVIPETFGRVAVEAMMNGIPVVVSDSGALPETVGTAGFVLPLPIDLTASVRTVPTAEGVLPWINTIVEIWDNESLYNKHSKLSTIWGRNWSADSLAGIYKEFMDSI